MPWNERLSLWLAARPASPWRSFAGVRYFSQDLLLRATVEVTTNFEPSMLTCPSNRGSTVLSRSNPSTSKASDTQTHAEPPPP
jgi:hypothetical protein